MAQYFRMPGLSADSEEVLLDQWQVKAGDEVSEGQPIATVETEKAIVDIQSEVDGVVHALLCADGATVPVGDPILVLLEAGEDAAAGDELVALVTGAPSGAPASDARPADWKSPAASGDTKPDTEASEVPLAEDSEGEGLTDADLPADAIAPDGRDDGERSAAAQTDAAQASAGAPDTTGEARTGASGGRVFATPLVRRLAKENGLDLDEITGTGINGRIVRRDIEAVLSAPPERPAAAQPAREPERMAPAGAKPARDAEFVPHDRLRRVIARRLQESKRDAPHFYVRRAARLDALLELRARINESAAVRVSVNDLVVKAAGRALADVPDMNVVWDDEGLYRLGTVDVAVAVASQRGLVTPVVRDVDQLSLSALSGQIKDLAARADANRLKQDELSGGALTVSNLGMYGVDEFDAIINPPQAAILAIGAARAEAVVTDGEVGVATLLRLSLSVDHRSVDGALAARYLARLVELLEAPFGLLV